MSRKAFTLIELLVVIGIMLALASLVAALYHANAPAERMRECTRIVTSTLAGAKDRAAHQRTAVGVRLIIDEKVPTAATGLQYLVQLPNHTSGKIEVWLDSAGDQKIVKELPGQPAGYPRTGWFSLLQAGALRDGARIRIPSYGSWYTADVSKLTAASETLLLSQRLRLPPIAGLPGGRATLPLDYILELSPTVAPNAPAVALPSGCAIDLAQSQGLTGTDIMFGVAGNRHAALPIYVLLAEIADIERGLDPSQRTGEQRVIVIRANGAVSYHQADLTDADANGKADDVFRLAR